HVGTPNGARVLAAAAAVAAGAAAIRAAVVVVSVLAMGVRPVVRREGESGGEGHPSPGEGAPLEEVSPLHRFSCLSLDGLPRPLGSRASRRRFRLCIERGPGAVK